MNNLDSKYIECWEKDTTLPRFTMYKHSTYHRIVDEKELLEYRCIPIIIRKSFYENMQENLNGKEYSSWEEAKKDDYVNITNCDFSLE